MRPAFVMLSVLALAGTAGAEGGLASAEGPAPESVRPSVEIETPYANPARPRPKGDVAAAVHDEEIARWNVGGTGDASFISNRAGYHPGTRVKVDSRLLAGGLPKKAAFDRRTGKYKAVLSETSLLARARKYGYWPFRLCFEQGVHDNAALRGGDSLLRLRVDAHGRVTSSRLISTKLKDASVAECMAERARELPLLPPPSAIELELKVSVWPGDAPLPALEKLAEGETRPAFHASSIRENVKKIESSFVECFSEGLARDGSLWGRVQIHVELDTSGSVRAARESESRFPDRDVSACVVRAIRQLTFSTEKSVPNAFEIGVRFGQPPSLPTASP